MKPHRLSAPVFLVGTAVAVVLVGLIAALVTWAFHPQPKPPCTIDCPPPQSPAAISATSTELHEQQTFTSPNLGFQVDYPSDWKLSSSNGDTALFSTRYGQLEVVGMQSTPGALQLIQQRIAQFKSPQLPDLAAAGPIHGAHIGSAEGQGQLFSGTFTPSSGAGRSLVVRIGIIVASKGSSTVVATAVVPYDTSGGRIMGDDIDYAMAEFRWSGE
jgi:hypothetical protein